MISRRAAAVVAGGLMVAGSSAAAAGTDPADNARLGPASSVGTYLGDPTPTTIWHGCTKTSIKQANVPREPGQVPVQPGSAQKAVTFTLASKPPYVSWKARSGWVICGVQVSATFSEPSDRANLLLGEVSYPSGTTKGSTSTASRGRESLKVRIPKDARLFGGKTASVYLIYDVTVFVKH